MKNYTYQVCSGLLEPRVTSIVITKDDILDVSLALAASASWDTLRLHDVAMELDVSLADIQLLVREKDDVTELLFDRADRAMLRRKKGAGGIKF